LIIQLLLVLQSKQEKMNLATPAPKVESVRVEAAIRESSEINVDTVFVEPAYADPPEAVEAAETFDDPRKFAPVNTLR
jgi:hypothetical protein